MFKCSVKRLQYYLPSENIWSDVNDHQGEPCVDNSPDGEGPTSWSDVCIIAGRHIACTEVKGTWRQTTVNINIQSLIYKVPNHQKKYKIEQAQFKPLT